MSSGARRDVKPSTSDWLVDGIRLPPPWWRLPSGGSRCGLRCAQRPDAAQLSRNCFGYVACLDVLDRGPSETRTLAAVAAQRRQLVDELIRAGDRATGQLDAS